MYVSVVVAIWWQSEEGSAYHLHVGLTSGLHIVTKGMLYQLLNGHRSPDVNGNDTFFGSVVVCLPE